MEKQTARIEAFCDGVFAIAITILIIEVKIPHVENGTTKELWVAFLHQWPSWLAFLVSFITILISWVVHSQGFKLIGKVSTKFTYANGLLMLTVIVLPFFTAAVAEYINTDLAQPPVTLYCAVSLFKNFAWIILNYSTLHPESLYKEGVDINIVIKTNKAMKFGFVFYSFTVILSFWLPITAFVLVALSYVAWLILGLSIKELNSH